MTTGPSGGVAASRLAEERKSWRKDHPFGFVAKPEAAADGSTNMFRWKCSIPGKEGTLWEGGLFPLTLDFSADYPAKPPSVYFPRDFYHPNVFPQGHVCLSIINPEKGWRPSITVKQILLGVQELLSEPNIDDPANVCYEVYKKDRKKYDRLVREQTQRYASDKQL
jgi:ubiquitin-conjugating enzyme E2 I